MTLLNDLAIVVEGLDESFEKAHPREYARSKDWIRDLRQLPEHKRHLINLLDACFFTMKLKVNVVLQDTLLTCGHPSPMCWLMVLGNYTADQITLGPMTLSLKPSDGFMVNTTQLVTNERFEGTMYQIELFCPPIGELLPGPKPQARPNMQPIVLDDGNTYWVEKLDKMRIGEAEEANNGGKSTASEAKRRKDETKKGPDMKMNPHDLRDHLVQAIETYLTTNASMLSPVVDNLQTPSSGPSGEIRFPLCVEYRDFDRQSPHWKAGKIFLRSMIPAMQECNKILNVALSESMKEEYRTFNRYVRGILTPLHFLTEEDVGYLHTMKLIANVAKEDQVMDCGHASSLVCFIVLGDDIDRADVICTSARTVSTSPRQAKHYRLEFFLATGMKHLAKENEGGGDQGTGNEEKMEAGQ